ncbi:MAG TPA: SAM-dependent methyltransferase, partial [Burkholderiaceae bacterium]|nr:SAM-dependent methyltransferase [Burkholderiaceae bacterium]
VPGASSPVAAFSIAGDAQAQGFCFHGFLPGKSGERREALQRLAPGRLADVLFEAPHRIASLAQDLAQSQPDRRLTVCRELTKQFEAVATLPAADLPAWLAADPNRQRGEFVLVLHALATRAADAIPERVELALPVLLQALPLKQAVALASTLSGAPRNAVYERALVLKAAAEQR